jgi:hypothetical protein
MQLLLALDSRLNNSAGFLFLDLKKNQWSFREIPIEENFKRKGFRGFRKHNDTIYALNSAALYAFKLKNASASGLDLKHEFTVRRPEWELGERAAADLHDLVISEADNCIYIANSYMDCIERVSHSGEWLGRDYLWDISPEIWQMALCRKPNVPDLVHVNHLELIDGALYSTLGNLNGSRKGALLHVASGQLVIGDLDFPHDGVLEANEIFFTNSHTSELVVISIKRSSNGLLEETGRKNISLPVNPAQFADPRQWLRGIAFSSNFIIVGSTQTRGELDELNPDLSPPHLKFLDRRTFEVLGELYLPLINKFANPCIFSLEILEDSDATAVDFGSWPPRIERPKIWKSIDFPGLPFRQQSREPGLSDWYWSKPASAPELVRAENGCATFQWNFSSPSERCYLITGNQNESFLKPIALVDLYQIAENTDTRLQVHISELSPFANVRLVFMEYSERERVQLKTFPLKTGNNVFQLVTTDQSKSFRMGLRFAGRGTISLTEVSLRQCAEQNY